MWHDILKIGIFSCQQVIGWLNEINFQLFCLCAYNIFKFIKIGEKNNSATQIQNMTILEVYHAI